MHHAGNSSGIVDGAGAVLLGSKEAGAKHGLKPRAKIRAFANIGSEPAMMLTGPVDVTEKLFERSGMKKSDIDLFELNEAFASVVLRYIQAFDIDNAKINVNGGAIALGHPLGATGAMILGTVLDELERTNKSTALVTLVHRRRHGHRDHHRARVTVSPSPLVGEGGENDAKRGSSRVSDCVGCQAGCHGVLFLSMALRMVRSLRATAMKATFLGFPAATRRSKKALRTGL